MKRTDLAKNLGLKIRGQMQHSPLPNRFGGGASTAVDRREQRKLDQAAGLVPFAAKLPQALVERLRALAASENGDLHAVTARVIEAGLGAPAAEKVAAKKAAVKKTAATAKKAPAKKAAAKKVAKE